MRILGLDIATVTGYGVIEDEEALVAHGSFKLQLDGDPNNDRKQYLNFAKKIKKLISTYKIDVVVLEYVYVGKNPLVSCNLNRLRGVAVVSIPPAVAIVDDYLTTMRKQLLGKGKNHGKKEVFNWIKYKYGLINFKITKDHDAADAIFLAIFGYRKVHGIRD